MKLLDRFERAMERLMEGTSGSLFRQPIQPAEIGKRLEREMLANRRASVGTSIVPNAYTVRLHPGDFEHFASYAAGLSRQMEGWLAQVATERNLSVVDRIRVTIEQDGTVRRRTVRVDASIADGRAAASRPSPRTVPSQATAAYDVALAPAESMLVLIGTEGAFQGEEITVTGQTSTIGRGSECDIVLDAPDVSRRHARISWTSGIARLEDMSSTNGTYVNGDPIRIADLEDGDEIRFGSHQFHARVIPNHPRPREFR